MTVTIWEHCSFYSTWLSAREQQKRTAAPLPWIGLYIAGASAVCFLALAADAVRGFCIKKPWIPCKFFAINAASLTLLAVAVKLPMDLTTSIPAAEDQLLKLTSTLLLSTSMSYTMPSLASMKDMDILVNIIALGILVVTLSVNLAIQMYTGVIGMKLECLVFVILILFQFIILCFSAMTVPFTKKILELKYKELQKAASNGNLSVQKLEERVIICWVMAETGSPQFVMARSVTSSFSLVICILSTITLVEATIFGTMRWSEKQQDFQNGLSDYGWSRIPTFLIHYLFILSVMALLIFRFLFTATNFKEGTIKNLGGDRFKVEKYWIQNLREWKERPLALPVRSRKLRKLIQDARNLVLNFTMKVQIVIVLLSKSVHLFLTAIVVLLWSCVHFFGRVITKISDIFGFTYKQKRAETESTVKELDLSHYVLLLDGEAKLPDRALKNICSSATNFIKRARTRRPENLKGLLQKSTFFKELPESSSSRLGGINAEEPLNCWTLPIVTLTSIAIALPNVQYQKTKWLLRSVAEGLSYACLVEKSLDINHKLMNISDTADVVWVGVELYRKWLDKNLQKLAFEAKTSTETLRILSGFAEEIAMDIKKEATVNLGDDPHYWPSKFIAANSMSKMCQTLLLECDKGGYLTNLGLFEKICIKIADIFASCLLNLPSVITMKCHSSSIEHREKNVREAARLLGESENILKVLLISEISSLNPEQALYIDESGLLLKQDSFMSSTSASGDEGERASSTSPSELHLNI